MRIINRDTVWRSGETINLRGQEVQVAPGATLTIEAGSKVNRGKITILGELNAQGSDDDKIEFTDIDFNFGSAHTTPGQMNISSSTISGGSFLEATGNGSYGSFNLSDNVFSGVEGFYIWYPVSENYIIRNTFIASQGMSVGLDQSAKLTVSQNVFYGSTQAYNSSSDAAIVSWATYGGAETFSVKYNSFISSINGVALELAEGYDSAAISALRNYYYTTDPRELRNLILDRSDSLSRSSYIDDALPLRKPHPFAPEFELPTIIGTNDPEAIFGTYANDTMSAFAGTDKLYGGAGNDKLNGGSENDLLVGGAGNDRLYGSYNNDVLKGGFGNDILYGNVGNDVLEGSFGKDTYLGGAGSDQFLFRKTAESPRGIERDIVKDFERGIDKINLRAIDADSTISGNQNFEFIRGRSFSEVSGELQFRNGIINADTNGDGVSDFSIEIIDVSSIVTTDFIF